MISLLSVFKRSRVDCLSHFALNAHRLNVCHRFSWGAAGVGTSHWTGVPLYRILNAAGIFEPSDDAQYVCFRGPKGAPAAARTSQHSSWHQPRRPEQSCHNPPHRRSASPPPCRTPYAPPALPQASSRRAPTAPTGPRSRCTWRSTRRATSCSRTSRRAALSLRG